MDRDEIRQTIVEAREGIQRAPQLVETGAPESADAVREIHYPLWRALRRLDDVRETAPGPASEDAHPEGGA